jgi:hypothetical protein
MTYSATDFGAENWRTAGVNCESADALNGLWELRIIPINIIHRICIISNYFWFQCHVNLPPLCMAFCLFFSCNSLCWANIRALLDEGVPRTPALPNAGSSFSTSCPIASANLKVRMISYYGTKWFITIRNHAMYIAADLNWKIDHLTNYFSSLEK